MKKWPREILECSKGIFTDYKKRNYYPRCCYTWTAEIHVHCGSPGDDVSFLVTLNQLSVLCAMDELLESAGSPAQGIPFSVLARKVGLDSSVVAVSLESLDNVLIMKNREGDDECIYFKSDWQNEPLMINLAIREETLRLKYVFTRNLQEYREDEEEHDERHLDPYQQTMDCPRRRCFDITSLRVIANWSWEMGIDNCAICRNHIMDLCIDCASHSGGSVEPVKDDCIVSWGICSHCFHLHCINRWLSGRTVCPLDNRPWEFQSYGQGGKPLKVSVPFSAI